MDYSTKILRTAKQPALYTWFIFVNISIFLLFALAFTNLSHAAITATPKDKATTAAPKDEETFKQNLAAAGLTYTLTGSNLEINVDQSKTIAALPKLQSLGYLSSNIPPSVIEQKPTLITFTISIIFTTAILHYNYQTNNNIDKIHVTSYIVPNQGGRQECYSFDFTRDLYTKTDWNKLSYNEFIKLIPNFNFTPWCRTQMTKEMGKQVNAPAGKRTGTTPTKKKLQTTQ